MSEEDALKKLLHILTSAYADLGTAPHGYDDNSRSRTMVMFTRLVLNDLNCYYPLVTPEEVKIAVNNGIRNQYGPYFGFNTISVHAFVEGYVHSEVRHEALLKQKKYEEYMQEQEALRNPKPKGHAKVDMEACTAQCRLIYNNHHMILDACHYVYDYLAEKGRIDLTPEALARRRTEAEIHVRQDLMNEGYGRGFMRHAKEVSEREREGRIEGWVMDLGVMEYFNALK